MLSKEVSSSILLSLWYDSTWVFFSLFILILSLPLPLSIYTYIYIYTYFSLCIYLFSLSPSLSLSLSLYLFHILLTINSYLAFLPFTLSARITISQIIHLRNDMTPTFKIGVLSMTVNCIQW